jgi:acetyl-CoA carboxylase biotin carboxyl carrier protein
MDIKEIKRLVKLMIDNDLSEMNISDGEQKISLRRGPGERGPVVVAGPAGAPQQLPEDEAKPGDDLIEITSPMVGTFYAAPSPDSDPHVALGDEISSDTVVCIVEAMKVMNEIKAECGGTIAEICIQNTQPVEFGQVLFRVRPN